MVDVDFPLLISRAQKGDRAAFEQIVCSTAPYCLRPDCFNGPRQAKAEDLTQETFLAAWNSIAALRNDTGFITWLLTLARNTTLDHAKFEGRKKRRDRQGPPKGEVADTNPTPAVAVEMNEAAARALQLLEDLPPEYREPLILRYLGGADYETIRLKLNLSTWRTPRPLESRHGSPS